MGFFCDAVGSFRLDPELARDLLDSTYGRHLADAVVNDEGAESIRDAIEHLMENGRLPPRDLEGPGGDRAGTDRPGV